MTWAMYHTESANYASAAEIAARKGNFEEAEKLYNLAAASEARALITLDKNKKRTLGITAVSAASLWYKAHDYQQAQAIAYQYLNDKDLPAFAHEQLKILLQTIWSAELRAKSHLEFARGEVLVSVSGGDVVFGGAPLDLIMDKVGEISRLFYRVIEMLLEKPLRRKGNPDWEIQEQCRPWLFQAPPGSYQFAVRIQRPAQGNLFSETLLPKIEHIADTFIGIVKAASQGEQEQLEKIVPQDDYRNTFLKMTRNLAPTGKTFSKMELRTNDVSESAPVVLIPEYREVINQSIRQLNAKTPNLQEETRISGILRALHLDNDWIELSLSENGKHIKVYEANEIIDDVVGAMVNRKVFVDVVKSTEKYTFKDIQLDE